MNTNRRAAVIGSTGMIGSHLVAEMVRAGYTGIILPVRDKSRVANIGRTFRRYGMDIPGGAFTAVETDVTDPATLCEVLRGTDIVFNCSGVIMTGDLTGRQLIDTNVALARAVAGASVAAGVRKLIHTSSIVVLAPGEAAGKPITETDRSHGGGSAYAQSKYLADCEMQLAAGAGISLNILYPAVVLGEGDWSANGSSALVPLMASGSPFYTDGVMAYADVRDVARAYITVDNCEAAAGQNFIVAGANLTYRELIDTGSEAAGKHKPFIRVDKSTAVAAYGFIKLATALRLMKDRGMTRSNLDSILRGNRYSGEKLAEICGFRYTPIGETIVRTVRAYIEEKKSR